jgi:hypothetical protein
MWELKHSAICRFILCPAAQVLMWLLAMFCGMVLGKLLIHGYLCGRLLRLKMFRDDQVPTP